MQAMQIIIMLIAVDGNVFSGKTILLKNLSKRIGGNIICEYSEYLKRIDKTPAPGRHDSIDTHQSYIDLDRERKIDLKKGINLLDRSFVSLSAHVYALFKKTKVDLRDKHLNLLNLAVNANNVLIPDIYIFLKCDRGTCLERYFDDKSSDHQKHTDSIFIDEEYFSFINKFNVTWQDLIAEKGVTIDNNDNAAQLAEFISQNNGRRSRPIDIIEALTLCYKTLA